MLGNTGWLRSPCTCFPNRDPKAGRAVKELLGIDEDYYIAVPPDPTDEEMKGVWATLRGLAKGGS